MHSSISDVFTELRNLKWNGCFGSCIANCLNFARVRKR